MRCCLIIFAPNRTVVHQDDAALREPERGAAWGEQ
jgi:hypothetical protein